MVDDERGSNGGGPACGGKVVGGSGDAVNGFAMEVENGVVERSVMGSGDAVNGSAIEVENGAAEGSGGALNGFAIVVENGPLEGSGDASKGFAIEDGHRAVKGSGDALNGFAIELENGAVGDGHSTGSSCEGLRTYKRRKLTKMSSSETKWREDGKVAADSVGQLLDKSVEETMDGVLHSSSCEQFSCPRVVSNAVMSGSDDFPLNCWRKLVEQMHHSVCESEGGLQGCIQEALLLYPESGCRIVSKGSVNSCDDNHKIPSQTGGVANETHGASKGNGLLSKSNCTNADKCQRAFFDTVTSDKFAQLCSLLLENFPGIKVDSFFNISPINSRMEEGVYESSPMLFQSDMQQIWTKLQKVGAEMVALGKSLSDKSRTSYHEHVGDLVHGTSEAGKDEFLSRGSDLHAKQEQIEACGAYKVCACQCCGEKADGRDCLVCDSCEEMYHVSCIEPAVEEIPSKSWYCAKCAANGIESPHGDCVLCEKLNASAHLNNGVEENSNGLSKHGVQLGGGKTVECCNVCRSEVDNGDNFRVCGHPFCLHKYYHVTCLTSKQLKTYGPRWYCPSCLCRGCLTDRDDEKIVLCDGCDHAYHIYCMQPPRNSVPRGKWFCRKCDVGIQRIRRAKRVYENLQKLKKRCEDENREKQSKESEELTDKSGGVDMLLTAARTLNYEEKMAGIEMKS